jgi:hypothetical protein
VAIGGKADIAQTAFRANNGDDSDVYFPFAKDAASLEVAIKRRRIDQANPKLLTSYDHSSRI